MVSTVTINRQRKIKMLKASMNDIIDLLLLQHRKRDMIHMKTYKELGRLTKKMLRSVTFSMGEIPQKVKEVEK